MHKPFDLEAAKAGEPVEVFFRATSAWEPVHFVGMDKHAQSVFQRERDGVMFPITDRAILRMAPKKVTVRYRVAAIDSGQDIRPMCVETEYGATNLQKNPLFVEWLTDWQEAEITPPEST